MLLDSLFLDEEDDEGRTKLDRPLPEDRRIVAMDEDTLRMLYKSRNRDEDALLNLLLILSDPTVVNIRIIAERAVIEYQKALEKDGRSN